MAQPVTLQVKGYREFMRAIAKADKDQKRAVRDTLRQVGEHVRVDAMARLAAKSTRSAAGYKTRVRQRGIIVEQSIRKTTGAHPEWGAYQMRHALIPALLTNEDDTERAMEAALDRVVDEFNRGSVT